jgi:hypothetical protein
VIISDNKTENFQDTVYYENIPRKLKKKFIDNEKNMNISEITI